MTRGMGVAGVIRGVLRCPAQYLIKSSGRGVTEDTVFGAAGHYFIGLQLFIDAHLVSKSIRTLEPRLGGTKSCCREIRIARFEGFTA